MSSKGSSLSGHRVARGRLPINKSNICTPSKGAARHPSKSQTSVKAGPLRELVPNAIGTDHMGNFSSKATEKKRKSSSSSEAPSGTSSKPQDLSKSFEKSASESTGASPKKSKTEDGDVIKISVIDDAQFKSITKGKIGKSLQLCLGEKDKTLPSSTLQKLCTAMLSNSTTKSLNLDGCGIGDEGCKHLAKMLAGNKVLRHLSLQSCNIGDLGCAELVSAVGKKGCLESLDLSKNNITDASLECMRMEAMKCDELRIQLTANPVSVDEIVGDETPLLSAVSPTLTKVVTSPSSSTAVPSKLLPAGTKSSHSPAVKSKTERALAMLAYDHPAPRTIGSFPTADTKSTRARTSSSVAVERGTTPAPTDVAPAKVAVKPTAVAVKPAAAKVGVNPAAQARGKCEQADILKESQPGRNTMAPSPAPAARSPVLQRSEKEDLATAKKSTQSGVKRTLDVEQGEESSNHVASDKAGAAGAVVADKTLNPPKKKKIATLGAYVPDTTPRTWMFTSFDGTSTYITGQELSSMLSLELHGNLARLPELTNTMLRRGRVASARMISEQSERILAKSNANDAIEMHSSLSSLSLAAHRAGMLDVDYGHFYSMLSQACNALCSDTIDQAEALAQSLFFSFTLDISNWSSSPPDGKTPVVFFEMVIQSQNNPSRAADQLVAKLITAIAKSPANASHLSSTLSLLVNAAWNGGEMLITLEQNYHKLASLRSRHLVIKALQHKSHAAALIDHLLLSSVGNACTDRAKRNSEASWDKYADVYSLVLGTPVAEGEDDALGERCMLLWMMARCLGVTAGLCSTNSGLEKSASALADAHGKLVGEDKDCLTRAATIAGIEVLMPFMSSAANKAVIKRAAVRAKASAAKTKVKGKKVVVDKDRMMAKEKGSKQEAAEKEEDHFATMSGVKSKYARSDQLPAGAGLIGVEGLEVKSRVDGGWWGPVYVETFNAKNGTWDCRWDGKIFDQEPGPGNPKDPAMWERGVTRDRIRLESKSLAPAQQTQLLVPGGKVCIMCPLSGVYRDAVIVSTQGKKKTLVKIEGFKDTHGVWNPRGKKEVVENRFILAIV